MGRACHLLVMRLSYISSVPSSFSQKESFTKSRFSLVSKILSRKFFISFVFLGVIGPSACVLSIQFQKAEKGGAVGYRQLLASLGGFEEGKLTQVFDNKGNT